MKNTNHSFEPADLLDKGFELSDHAMLDGEDYFKSYTYKANDSEICITHEHDALDTINAELIFLNCEMLRGRKPSWKELVMIMEIM